MTKPGRILLLFSFATVLVAAGTWWSGDGEELPRHTRDVTTVPGTSGIRAAIDPETGTLTRPSPEQIRELEQLSGAAKARPSHVETFVLEDGTVGALLDERFDQLVTVHVGLDGKRQVNCQPAGSGQCMHTQPNVGAAAALPEK